MNKVKYIHILWQNEIKFNPRMVKIVHDEKDVFNEEEHFFVTPHEKVYNEIKDYGNVYLDVSGANLINKYAPLCNWIIYHGHIEPFYGAKIKKKNYRKLILRYWGGNFGYTLKRGQFFKNMARRWVDFIYINKIRNIAAIGIANKVDEVSIHQQLGNIPTLRMPYGMGKKDEIINAVRYSEKDSYINVMVGHSAWPYDSHIEILEKLSKYGDKIRIYVPLSYGSESYRIQVDNYIKERGAKNIIPIRDFMPYDDYVRLLNKMDIAILNGEISYALGNVAILLLFKKKIFLNDKGIIKKAFDMENMPYCCVDEIDSMDFESFIKPLEYPETLSEDLIPYSKEKAFQSWELILKSFN